MKLQLFGTQIQETNCKFFKAIKDGVCNIHIDSYIKNTLIKVTWTDYNQDSSKIITVSTDFQAFIWEKNNQVYQ